ncbi:MAG: hypothetical protein HN981_01885 [Candidatus Pacebacteria bacterium]|jgi:hypothetical protein|nr:hypothetical protein [Candidatus Paceibacterota bacterium]MBT4652756.1 hypothetical protein [Candidatus Paceibacterota bacterium]MBT6755913.1 hypothetical protein [Candidatus Paceibacterota bacterium]MBT6921126.1 hypothetical protein [Candidatus Paceibacterota bacterium]
MNTQSFVQLGLYIVLISLLISFEAVFGFAWLSIFFMHQILIRVSDRSFWILGLLTSFLLSVAFSISIVIPLVLILSLWFLHSARKKFLWWMFYGGGVLLVGWQSDGFNSWSTVVQSLASLLVILVYVKGIIWWPKIWKNNEKIY